MPTPENDPIAHDVNACLARYVPITQAMGIRLRSFGADGVVMTAPLAPNINDKAMAFGGTLASLLSLCAWALTDLVLRGAGLKADVIIASSTIEYRLPVTGEIVARCPRPPAAEEARFLDAYRARGRARWELRAFVEARAGTAADFRGLYVARRPAGIRER
jgi:thioesterase domain-containing protein